MQRWLQQTAGFRIANWVEYVVLNLNKAPVVWDCFPNNSIKFPSGSKKRRVQRKRVMTLLPCPPALW